MPVAPDAEGGTSSTERLDPALLKLIGILSLGALAPLLDTTIVNVALATLGRDLHAAVATIQWVTTGYLLALGLAIPLSGWLTARLGGKRAWMVSLAIFLIGSVLSGAAWSVGSLVIFRLIQGAGGGLMQPILQTLLVQAAGPGRLGRAVSVITVLAVVAPIFGPVLGGLIVTDLNWRWIFYVNVPLCVVALVLAWRGLAATPSARGYPLDVLGLTLLSPALAAILYGLSQAGVHGGFGNRSTLTPLAIGGALLAAFAVHARRTRGEPIIDLSLFRLRPFATSASLLFLSGLSLFGAMLLLPLYYQEVRSQTALAAGLLLAPQGIGSLLTRWAGALTDRVGPKPIVLSGLALAVLGTLPYTQVGPHSDEVLLRIALVVRGAGLGAATIAMVTSAYQGLSSDQIPQASSVIRLVQQIGGSFGTAVLAVILQQQVAGHPAGVGGHAEAFGVTFWWSIAFTVLALVPALLLPGHSVGDRKGSAAESRASG